MRLIEQSEAEVDVAVRQVLAVAPSRPATLLAGGLSARLSPGGFSAWLSPGVRRGVTAAAVVAVLVLPLLTLAGAFGEALTGDLTRDRELGASLVVIAAAVVCAALALRAAMLLRRDRGAALRILYVSLLVDLLIGQVFKFTVNQFAAVTEAVLTVVLLVILGAEIRAAAPSPHPRAAASDDGVRPTPRRPPAARSCP
jgi:hypothetical protein